MVSTISYDDLERKIVDRCLLKGDFTLRSGKKSDTYFDKYLLESDPVLLWEICTRMNYKTKTDFDMFAGLEMGGIPFATILSHQSGKPSIFVRKQAKEYGTSKLAEGLEFSGKKLRVIEDVVTTGGQVIMSCKDLEARGAIIESVSCAILRSNEGRENIENVGYTLYNLFDFTARF